MGKAVTLSTLDSYPTDAGVSVAPITSGMAKFAAEFIQVMPGNDHEDIVPSGSDCYLFVVSGYAHVSSNGGDSHDMPLHSFAAVQEGTAVRLDNPGDQVLEVIRVVAPPPDSDSSSRSLEGLKNDLQVIARDAVPPVSVPEQRKTRLYFVGHGGAKSERANAMIVLYEKETITPLHHHPDAESIFILLEGKLKFTVNGEDVMVVPGDAAYFAMNDKHGLRVADDSDHAAFLEFHVPAAFSVVKE